MESYHKIERLTAVDNIETLLEDVEPIVREMVSLLVENDPSSAKAAVSVAVLTAFICDLYEISLLEVSAVASAVQRRVASAEAPSTLKN